jgi:hypothetical protein
LSKHLPTRVSKKNNRSEYHDHRSSFVLPFRTLKLPASYTFTPSHPGTS